MKTGDHLFLVDGSGYIFRAYHALPPLNRKSDGLPTNAVLGFCNMVWKLMQDSRNTDVGVVPTHFAVIFDYSSKTFRNEIFAEYKANRSESPTDFRGQVSLVQEVLAALHVPVITADNYEADDVIATLTVQAVEQGPRRWRGQARGVVAGSEHPQHPVQLLERPLLVVQRHDDREAGSRVLHRKDVGRLQGREITVVPVRWQPGDAIVRRDVWRGEPTVGWGGNLVSDTDDLLVLYMPEGAPLPDRPVGVRVQERQARGGSPVAEQAGLDVLALHPPGRRGQRQRRLGRHDR